MSEKWFSRGNAEPKTKISKRTVKIIKDKIIEKLLIPGLRHRVARRAAGQAF